MTKAFIFKKSIYDRGFQCECGAVLLRDGKPTDDLGKDGDNLDSPILYCVRCHSLVGVEKDIKDDIKCEGEWTEELKQKYGSATERECWGFAVGNITMNPFKMKKCKRALDYIMKQDGFLGFHPQPPRGTICVFDTENNAKGARNMCRSVGIECGKNIGKCFVDMRFLNAKNK